MLALLVPAGGPPDGGSRHARQFHAIGSHDEVQAVHEGQHDRQQHAGFDRERHDQSATRRHQQDLGTTAAVNADHFIKPKDLDGDVEENSGERRMRQIGQQARRQEEKHDHEADGGDRDDLRAAAGFDDDGGAGRTGIDGEGAGQACHDAAGADAGKVAAGIVRPILLRWKGARDRGGLHDADHGDDEGQR